MGTRPGTTFLRHINQQMIMTDRRRQVLVVGALFLVGGAVVGAVVLPSPFGGPTPVGGPDAVDGETPVATTSATTVTTTTLVATEPTTTSGTITTVSRSTTTDTPTRTTTTATVAGTTVATTSTIGTPTPSTPSPTPTDDDSDDATTPDPTTTTTEAETGSPAFDFEVTDVERCGDLCRTVTADLRNTGDADATGVEVIVTAVAGSTEVWTDEYEPGTVEAGASHRETGEIRFGLSDARAVRENDDYVEFEVLIDYDGGEERTTNRVRVE
jgi:hypothetical protein